MRCATPGFADGPSEQLRSVAEPTMIDQPASEGQLAFIEVELGAFGMATEARPYLPQLGEFILGKSFTQVRHEAEGALGFDVFHVDIGGSPSASRTGHAPLRTACCTIAEDEWHHL